MKIENKIIEKRLWQVTVDNNIIKVVNKPHSLELIINDKIQDVYLGTFLYQGNHLTGKLNDGKEIKVSYGGDFKLRCCIFVDNELVLEDKKQ